MTEFPETRLSLLAKLQKPEDAEAWERFERLYGPVIFRLARRRGLQDADALDLVQQVFMRVAGAIESWEPAGQDTRFRHWLRRVVRNTILNLVTRRPPDRALGGDQEPAEINERQAEIYDAEVELEYRRELYLQASKRVRAIVDADSWTIFERSVVQQEAIAQVAEAVGKSLGAAYVARCRVMQQLREAVKQLEADDE